MNTEFKPKKYDVGASGSGWGVWEISSGRKIESFGGHPSNRIKALELMYQLNGWNKPTQWK